MTARRPEIAPGCAGMARALPPHGAERLPYTNVKHFSSVSRGAQMLRLERHYESFAGGAG